MPLPGTIPAFANPRPYYPPSFTPQAPTLFARTANTIDVDYLAPTDNGGGTVVYRLRWRVQGTTSWFQKPTTESILRGRISGATASTTYEIQERAENEWGVSDWSASAFIATLAVAP